VLQKSRNLACGASTSLVARLTAAHVCPQVPKDTKVIVACQKGLRSLVACEQLSRAGYKDIAWINGGFDNSTAGQARNA
jgi:rhodanese-related sulfurtransferase